MPGEPPTSSNNGLGFDFQPFEINGFKMVDQTRESWNQCRVCLSGLAALYRAA
jgi:hypothetical protein